MEFTSATQFCPSCGSKLETGDQFCNKCGRPISGSVPPLAAPSATSGRHSFSKGEAIRFAWTATKSNLGLLILAILISGAVSQIPAVIQLILGDAGANSRGAWTIFGYLLGTLVGVGIIRISLKICDGKKAGLGDLFSGGPVVIVFIIAEIVFYLAFTVGLIAFLVGSIFIAVRLQFFGYLIVDKGLGPIQALKESFAITKGHFWNLLLFSLILAGINLVGMVCLLVGLFVTIPLTLLAVTYAYRQLASSSTPMLA